MILLIFIITTIIVIIVKILYTDLQHDKINPPIYNDIEALPMYTEIA